MSSITEVASQLLMLAAATESRAKVQDRVDDTETETISTANGTDTEQPWNKRFFGDFVSSMFSSLTGLVLVMADGKDVTEVLQFEILPIIVLIYSACVMF